jgi:hypothetical protein
MTGPTMNINYDGISSTTLINSVLTFDVNMGIPGNESLNNNTPTTNQLLFQRNISLWNRDHLNLRNDTLKNNNTGTYFQHPVATIPTTSIRFSYMLNREIGNDSIHLENRTLPWVSTLSINRKIVVNERSLYYTYPSVSNPLYSRPSVWSKENPYIITNTGKANLRTNPFLNINYTPPYTGIYTQSTFTSPPCTNNYNKQLELETLPEKETSNVMTLFPNPTFTKQIVLQFVPNSIGNLEVRVYDLQGRIVYQTYKEINTINLQYTLPIQLPTYLNAGMYIVSSRLNNNNFINKLNIQ